MTIEKSESGIDHIHNYFWEPYQKISEKFLGFARGREVLEWLDNAARKTILHDPDPDVLADPAKKEVQYENLVQAILLYCLINIMCDDVAETANSAEKLRFMDYIKILVKQELSKVFVKRPRPKRSPVRLPSVTLIGPEPSSAAVSTDLAAITRLSASNVSEIASPTGTSTDLAGSVQQPPENNVNFGLTNEQQAYVEHLNLCVQEMLRLLKEQPHSDHIPNAYTFLEQFNEMFVSCYRSITFSQLLQVNYSGRLDPEEDLSDDRYLRTAQMIERDIPSLEYYINMTAGNMGTGVMVAMGAGMMKPEYIPKRKRRYTRYTELARKIAKPGRVCNDLESLEREVKNGQANGLIYLYVTGKNESENEKVSDDVKVSRLKEVRELSTMPEGNVKDEAARALVMKILTPERVDAMLDMFEKGKNDIATTNFNPKFRINETFVPNLDIFMELSLKAAPKYIQAIVRERMAVRQERKARPLTGRLDFIGERVLQAIQELDGSADEPNPAQVRPETVSIAPIARAQDEKTGQGDGKE